ncbi:MAG: SPOR domain-containing protein [Treponema sp.]
MEQKKILWVILSVSVFVLVIFGVALFLYSPSRAQNTAVLDKDIISYEGNAYPQTAVDPEKWTREPDKIAELDKSASPAIENIINLNIVANDPAAAEQKGIDVSGLTEQEQMHADNSEQDALPAKLAEGIGITAQRSEKPVESQPQVVAKPAVQPIQKKQVKPAVEKKTVPQKKPVQAQKPKTAKKEPALQNQTLYWVQTASLASRINAERARDVLAAEHMKVEIFTKETSAGLTHRVRVGPFSNHTEASYWLKNIQKMKGFEHSYMLEEQIKS